MKNSFSQILPATIFNQKCNSCHNVYGSAPFSFITFADIASRKSMIKNVIESNIMPQWIADTSYSKFKNCRALNLEEKKQILYWVKNLKKNSFKEFTSNSTNSHQIKNDYYDFKYPYTIILKPSMNDTDISFEFPFDIDNAAEISQIVFYCSNLKLIHHANIFILDSFKYTNHKKDTIGYSIAYGYAPGNKQEQFEDSMGYLLPKSGVITGDIHFSSRLTNQEITFGIQLIKSKIPLKKILYTYTLQANNFNAIFLEPDSIKHYVFTYSTFKDLHVLYTHPHMHIFGKKFLSYAITPSNDTINIINIKNWDFYQQEYFEFKEPLFLPKNSKIVVDAWYDNTKNNPLNPFLPPKLVTGGISTNQEMLTNILIYYIQ